MTQTQVASKLAQLERDIELLKRQVTPPVRNGRWYIENAGQFKDDPIYAQIARLGRKYRESLRPKASRKKRR